jgi:hypothetical protein
MWHREAQATGENRETEEHSDNRHPAVQIFGHGPRSWLFGAQCEATGQPLFQSDVRDLCTLEALRPSDAVLRASLSGGRWGSTGSERRETPLLMRGVS